MTDPRKIECSMTITEFLLARIAEDETKADEMESTAWYEGGWATEDADRLRKDCAAKRAIIGSQQSCAAMAAKERDPGVKLVGVGMEQGLSLAVKSLAAVYADHLAYQQKWAA